MLLGSIEIEAVGAGGGGGGGGGGGVFFLPHAPSIKAALRATINTSHLIPDCFTFIPPATPKLPPRARRSYLLFPTPIRLGVAPRKRQLLNLGSVGKHAPDLQASGTIRLKHNVPSVRRPRGEI